MWFFIYACRKSVLNAAKAVSAWGLAPMALSATKLSLLKSNKIAWKNKRA